MLHNSIINAKWLKEFSVIPLNFNTKEIENFIGIAQTVWIIPVIGYPMFEELVDQVKNNNLTPENSTLLVEAIYPYLAMAVVYESLPSLLYHVSEVSITKGHSDTSEALDLKEAAFYESWIRRQLEARKDYAIKWIAEHIEYYPLISNCDCECSCCANPKLQHPNPNFQLYSPYRRNTNIR